MPKNKNKNLKRFSLKGFTLVEVMAVIAIISIMTGVMFVGMDSNTRIDSNLKSAARTLAAALRKNQSDALNGKMGGGNVACGHGISFEEKTEIDSKTDHVTFIYAEPSSSCPTVGQVPVSEGGSKNISILSDNDVKFPKGIKVSQTYETEILFMSPSARQYRKEKISSPYSFVDMSDFNDVIKIRLESISDSGKFINVCIKDSGQIKESEVGADC